MVQMSEVTSTESHEHAELDELFEKGLRIRRSIVGEQYVDNSLAAAGDYGMPFQKFLTAVCWGATWGREGGLSPRDRSLLNLGIIGALGRPNEFKTHVRGALVNGLSAEEIREAIIQLATYAGIPLGLEAMKGAQEVVAKMQAQ